MPAANFLATWSSLVMVLHGVAGLFVDAEEYSVVSIIEAINELTGIVTVAGAAHLSWLLSRDAEAIV